MNEDDVVDLLDRLGAQVPVTPAPLDHIFSERSRLHRRRITRTLLGSTATAAVILTTSIAVAQEYGPSSHSSLTSLPTRSSPLTQATPPVAPAPPAGDRLVGVGHASIAVPKGWGTNQISCGPTSASTNTVVIDVIAYAACSAGLSRGASVVQVGRASALPRYPGFTPARHIMIDGHPALRTRIICTFRGATDPPCTAAVLIPSESAGFQVTSYRASVVGHLLDSIGVHERQVAVPETYDQVYDPDGAQKFISAAHSLGLKVDIITGRVQRHREGGILSVLPYSGTMLAPGDTVHLTVAP